MKTLKRIIAIVLLLAIIFALGYVAYTAKIFGELKDTVSAILWR